MASNIKAHPEKNIRGALDTRNMPLPPLDPYDAAVKELIRSAKKRGYVTVCQIASNRDPHLARKNDPSDVAETDGAEPQIAEQSRSWRAAIGEREVMRGS